jgi:hypothetical protein
LRLPGLPTTISKSNFEKKPITLMSREIPAGQFCLGTHPSMKLQREAVVNPSGNGNAYSTERFGKWFEEIRKVFKGDTLSVDTAALYQ